MPLAPGLASMVALASPPPILPLMASKVSAWPSLLTVPLTGRVAAARQRAAQCLKRDLAVPAFH